MTDEEPSGKFGWFTLDQSSESKSSNFKRLSVAFAVITIIFVGLFIALFILVTKDDDKPDLLPPDGGLEKNASGVLLRLEGMEKDAFGTLDRLTETKKSASGVLERLENIEKNASNVLSRLEELEKAKEQALNKTKLSLAKILATWYEASDGTLYKRFNEAVNYETAETRCEEFGAFLLSKGLRNDATLRKLVQANVLVVGYQGWIGYNDIVEEGGWVWPDGGLTNTTVVQWYADQPDNWYDGENCAQMRDIYSSYVVINDRPCSDNHQFICEI